MLESQTPSGPADRRELDVLRARSELQRRFGTGAGCAARARDYARLFPSLPEETVEEALHRLADEGAIRLYCLADGAFAFHFPPA